MRFGYWFAVLTLSLSLPVLAFSQAVPEATSAFDPISRESSIEWPMAAPDWGMVLTVSGPGGLYLKEAYEPGSWPRFSLVDERGRLRPDGVYKWELVSRAATSSSDSGPARSEVRSGWFQVRGGRILGKPFRDETAPIAVEQGAPANTVYVDREGHVGIGTSLPYGQLHLKGASPSIAVEDTSTGGREYLLRSHESGDGSLGLFDETTGKARWLVDSEGRLGINTTEPKSTLTVDGYIESTKGFLVNGRPIGLVGLSSSSQPLATESINNNFFGPGAGIAITSGVNNAFFGTNAGAATTTGVGNSFFGTSAGVVNTYGNGNALFGYAAGQANTTGSSNSFFGGSAGYGNTTGMGNCFFGGVAGSSNTTGNYNVFLGAQSGVTNTTGNFNTGVGGRFAGWHNTVEENNTFIGSFADLDPGAHPGISPVTNATAIGYKAFVSRSNSLVLGGVKGFNSAFYETFVGIGTTSPDRQLVVEGSQAIGKFRRFSESGPDFGPAFLFERARGTNTAAADMLPGDYLGKVQFRGRVGGNMLEYGALTFVASDTSQNGRFSFVDRDLVTERMVVLNTGNVGIGTNAPTERLDVVGNLRVRGSIVYGAPAVVVPDYVFEPDYTLMPISDLAAYINQEKHLPAIPNASEIQANGVNLGEFQMKLLQKVEELTLYAVQQAKRIEELEQKVRQLEGNKR